MNVQSHLEGRELLQLNHQATVLGVAFRPDGRQRATASAGTARYGKFPPLRDSHA